MTLTSPDYRLPEPFLDEAADDLCDTCGHLIGNPIDPCTCPGPIERGEEPKETAQAGDGPDD